MLAAEPLPSAPAIRRYTEIDGIRGWAALIVVLFHFTHETFGAVFHPFTGPKAHLLFNGPLAVYIFFVLSGDALSIGYLRTGDRTVIDRLAIKRYFRLTIPIALVCFITYGLMVTGLTFNQQAGVVVHNVPWLGSFIAFDPGLVDLVGYALYGVYATHATATSYNAFLWTMSIELIGSLLVFVFLYASQSLKKPGTAVLVVALALYVLGSWYCLFFAGMALGRFRNEGGFDRMQGARWHGRPPSRSCSRGSPRIRRTDRSMQRAASGSTGSWR